jgi:endonuclease/exonuclease/phosphatase family metal-dependent hydrolase
VARQEVPARTGVPAHVITVGSLNLAGKAQIGDALAEWTERRGIDVLLLQEVGHAEIDGEPFAAALSQRLRFHSVYSPASILESGRAQGLAIVSRYPLEDVHVQSLPYHRLRFRSRCRIALAVTVGTAAGRIRLVNVHLDTRINSDDRLAQLAPVLGALDSLTTPQLIGGDFNTMDVRWLQSMWPLLGFERQAKAVAERLAALGFRTPFQDTGRTIRFPLLPFRLDWLYLKNFAPLEWSVDVVPLTDHRGVWARMRF